MPGHGRKPRVSQTDPLAMLLLAVVSSSWCQPWTFVTLTAHSLGRAVEEGLTYRFHAAWSSVLQLLCVFFEACGRQAHPVMKKVSGPGQEVALGC